MNWKSAMMASAVAGLFLGGGAAVSLADSHEKSEAKKIKCHGVNKCKGQGACGGEGHACAGHNGCEGKGFLMLTPDECEQAKDAAKGGMDEESH